MYNILIEKNAEKSFRKIPANIIQKLIIKIKSLKNNPKPVGYRKIIGTVNDYRLRIGD